jgi:hypothetical protein
MTRAATIVVAAALVAAAAAGCATNPATGLRASGQPLGIKTEYESVAYRDQQKVGEVQYQNAAGQSEGSASIYQTSVGHATKIHWQPTQGNAVIDDQDFFRIAGDTASEREVEEYRRQGKALNRVGWGLTLLGAGGVAASTTLMDETTKRARTIGGVSVLALITGAAWVYYGYYRTQPDHHAVELERARQAATRYNETLKAEGAAAKP